MLVRARVCVCALACARVCVCWRGTAVSEDWEQNKKVKKKQSPSLKSNINSRTCPERNDKQNKIMTKEERKKNSNVIVFWERNYKNK